MDPLWFNFKLKGCPFTNLHIFFLESKGVSLQFNIKYPQTKQTPFGLISNQRGVPSHIFSTPS